MTLNFSKKDILQLINDINVQDKFNGLIPISILYSRLNYINLSLKVFQSLILELESENKIYLEPINDPTRLTVEERNIAIYQRLRGSLFYIGTR